MSSIAPNAGPLAVLIESGGEPNEATPPQSLSLDPVSNSESTVMIVGSDPSNVEQLMRYLQEGGWGRFLTATNHEDAIELVRQHRPDVLLFDLTSQSSTGVDLLKWRLTDARAQLTPVIVVTASSDPSEKIQAMEQGATDFLSRPVDPCELVFRIHNALVMKSYRQQVEQNSAKLEAQVRRRTRELEASRQEAILCLARAAEYRDDDTGKHVIRVGRYTGIICRKLGISERVATLVEQAAQLHDMGKIGIPDAILLKPGRLESHEFDIMKNHCPIGRKIIQPLTDREWKALRQHTHMAAAVLGIPSSPIMKMAAVIAQTHHEKWDGSGYPLGLKGEEIPLEGRIVAVADVYDALSSERPYKNAFSQEKCCEIIQEGRGKHFDPRIADAFFASLEQISQVQSEFADAEGHFLGARTPLL